MRSFLMRQLLRRQERFFEILSELERTQYYSDADMRDYQEEKLRAVVRHAYATVPFYRTLFDQRRLTPADIKTMDDLQKLPLIDKETVRRHRPRMLSSAAGDKIRVSRTGGSTGVPLSISRNRHASVFSGALYYRFMNWMGYGWGDRIVLFWGEPVVESPMAKVKSAFVRKIQNKSFVSTFDVDDGLLRNLVRELKSNPPRVLRGYASSIYLLARQAIDSGDALQLNAVSTTAERLYSFQRSAIERAFGQNLFDQYGCGECNSIAFECARHKGLHIALEHVTVELVDGEGKPGDEGEVALTTLENYAMPLIRYKNGDIARWANERCPCGRCLPLLAEVQGRVSDFIEGVNGKKVHAEFFSHLFGGLKLAERYGIREFRVVQEQSDRLAVEFVADCRPNEADIRAIEEWVEEYLGRMSVEVRRVDSIPLTKMGKKLFVLSQLNREMWAS